MSQSHKSKTNEQLTMKNEQFKTKNNCIDLETLML